MFTFYKNNAYLGACQKMQENLAMPHPFTNEFDSECDDK